MNAQDSIMHHLKGHTAQKPMRGDSLLAALGLEPDTLDSLLDDLQGRGALCRAEITRHGEKTWTALWPTGLVPRAMSWKQERDHGTGTSADLAHNVQQSAEQSRQSIATLTTENTMTKSAQPAPATKLVVKTLESNRPHNLTRNTGVVQQTVISVLRTGGQMDVESIFAACDVETSLGSVGKTLENLAKRGAVVSTIKFHNHRNRRFYCLPDYVPNTDDAVDHRHDTAANIATLRRIAADEHTDHDQSAGNLVDPADVRPEVFESAVPDAHVTRAAAVADLETSSPRWALWDNGSLMITSGDEILALTKADTARLAYYLRNVSDHIYDEALA